MIYFENNLRIFIKIHCDWPEIEKIEEDGFENEIKLTYQLNESFEIQFTNLEKKESIRKGDKRLRC